MAIERTDEHAARRSPKPAHDATGDFTRREALKTGAAGLLCGWEFLASARIAAGQSAAASEAAPFDARTSPVALLFDEPRDRPAGSLPWPVTVGVPMGNGALDSLDGLAIFSDDSPAPAQFVEALRWRFGHKTISWVHCDLQARLGKNARPAASLRGGQTNPAPPAAVTVVDRDTHYQVDTGAVSFTCSKSDFNLFDSFVADDRPLIKSSSLYWKDTQGNLYEGRHGVSEVAVEKSGPMRAVIRYDGWYQSAAGARRLRYSVWLHAFAGLPYVRIYDKLIWTENLTLFVSIDTATGTLTTNSLFADRSGSATSYIAHGWSTGDPVKWAYSHSEKDEWGANQYYDNTSARGRATVVLPTVVGEPLDRDTIYYVRVTGDSALSLHRSEADAREGARPLQFVDAGVFTKDDKTYVGRHYLEAQQPVLAEWGLKFDLAEPVRQSHIDVVGAPHPAGYDLPTTTSVTAYQKEYGTATLTAGEGKKVQVEHLAGWADARFASGAGLAVSVKALSSQSPKVLHVDGSSLTVKLWGGGPMSLREADRVPPDFQKIDYPKEWLAFCGEPNPVGIGKTHEIWVWPTRPLADNRLINDLVQRPVACCPDPTYACATDYLIGVRAASRTPTDCAYVETALENMFRYFTARYPSQGDYDEWNFGDLRLYRNGAFRTWDNGGSDCNDLFWRQWYRTGKRFFLEEGIHNSRHVMDVDTIAHSQAVSGGNNTYLRIAGRTNNFSTLHWSWTAAYGDVFVDHPAYLLLCWLMTGYEPARVVLETKCQERKNAGYGDPGKLDGYNLATVTREQYSAAPPKFIYHELTGDPKFYDAGRNWLQLAMNAQAASRETNSAGAHLFPNNNFWGFFYDAFLYCYQYGGEASVLGALAQTVSDFAVLPRGHYEAPTFACTWPEPSRLVRARSSMLPFVAAYMQTGDLAYLQFPVDRVLRQCRTVQASGPLLGYDVINGPVAAPFLRDAIMVLGAWSDADHSAIKWPGNLPLVGSSPISGAPWLSQLTLWAKKPFGAAGNIRLLFKDVNLTNFEAPGRVRAVIVEPNGGTHQRLLTADVTSPVKADNLHLTPTGEAHVFDGQPIRFSTDGALPRALSAETTYYIHVLAGTSKPTWTIHPSFAEAIGGGNPLDLSGGTGGLSIVTVKTPSEVVIPLAADAPAGTYRIHVQGEFPLFRLSPASDLPGLVVELHGLNDLTAETCFGAAEFHFRMRPSQKTLTLSTPKRISSRALPVAVLDPHRNLLARFDYDGGDTAAADFDLPIEQVGQVLTLAKGYEEFSPQSLDALPILRLGGAERYIAVTSAQWFNPMAAFDREIAAFWSFDEAEGVRRDATGHGRDLSEHHGPIAHDRESHLGSAAEFAPPGNGYLSSPDPVFQATDSFTVWGWARLANIAETRYLFVKGGDVANVPASCEWAVYAQPNPSPRIYLQARSGKRFAFTRGLPFAPDGELHFVVAWYDARAKKMFLQVDEEEIDSQVLAGPINVGAEPFGVGGSSGNGRGWIGQIAAVGFAKTVLTAAERNLLYNGGSGRHFPF